MFSRMEGLYLAPAMRRGLGLFRRLAITKGEVIEIAPVIVFNEEDATSIDKTLLYNYYFATSFLPDSALPALNIKDKDKAGCLALGLLSFCNHADDPNARIEKKSENGMTLFSLEAMRDIPADEEIRIAYGQIWFEAN